MISFVITLGAALILSESTIGKKKNLQIFWILTSEVNRTILINFGVFTDISSRIMKCICQYN